MDAESVLVVIDFTEGLRSYENAFRWHQDGDGMTAHGRGNVLAAMLLCPDTLTNNIEWWQNGRKNGENSECAHSRTHATRVYK